MYLAVLAAPVVATFGAHPVANVDEGAVKVVVVESLEGLGAGKDHAGGFEAGDPAEGETSGDVGLFWGLAIGGSLAFYGD